MNVFESFIPQGPVKGLISIPHSGLWIPDEFEEFLSDDQGQRNRDVDFAINELIDIERLNQNGIYVQVQNLHRICVDLNRPRETAVLNWKQSSQQEPIVAQEPTPAKAEELLTRYYDPYFAELTKYQVTKGFHAVDLHSMPSEATAYHLAKNPHQDKQRPEICLSDLQGKSVEGSKIFHFQQLMAQKLSDVRINAPYFGGFVTQKLNDLGFEVFQIEIRRNLYMDEQAFQLKPEAKSFGEHLTHCLLSYFESRQP